LIRIHRVLIILLYVRITTDSNRSRIIHSYWMKWLCLIGGIELKVDNRESKIDFEHPPFENRMLQEFNIEKILRFLIIQVLSLNRLNYIIIHHFLVVSGNKLSSILRNITWYTRFLCSETFFFHHNIIIGRIEFKFNTSTNYSMTGTLITTIQQNSL